ncbi:DUF533 domain-containing protein [Methylobacterium sp. BTF04]|uniref:DUF533 domain-containing protein n=1 Tax=Methylobacterium sp. BTF04 TaxID=2708300 RepID=UPI0013D59BA8|nr:DUF533 domain-containing protein [Methylobacterium sp. BTF04]NEU14006.1 DUF533 domain-containing protein [Methylobacterium sp. BTF04]
MADAKTIVDTLVRSRRGSLAAGAALGGLALVVGLAARALHHPAEIPDVSVARDAESTPFDHATIGEDEARLMLRAMVSATMADGLMDDTERKRLQDAIAASGIEKDAEIWLRNEMDEPADVDEIAERVKTPEQATRIYAAARLAIDADTLQEREFLKMLAVALDVPHHPTTRLDAELSA